MTRPTRWSLSVVVLHWLNAALILALLAEGWAMTHAVFGAATTFDLYQQHKSLGFTALALTALRIALRLRRRAPARAPGWEGRLARAVQASFYLLTLLAVGAGWLVVSTSPLPVPTRFFGLFVVPNIARPTPRFSGGRRLPIASRPAPSPASSRCMSPAR